MAETCFDTSGLSHPWEEMPDPPHGGIWKFVRAAIENGEIAMTREVFDEMCKINGGLGDFIEQHKDAVLYEVGEGDWDWGAYLKEADRIAQKHKEFVSDWTGGSPKTICLNDISGIALASTLKIEMVSGEKRIHDLVQAKKRKIPDVCVAEGVTHRSFNDYLLKAGYKG